MKRKHGGPRCDDSLFNIRGVNGHQSIETFCAIHEPKRWKRARVGLEQNARGSVIDCRRGVPFDFHRLLYSILEIMTSEFSNPTIQTLGIRAIVDCYYLRHFSPHALEVIIASVLNHSSTSLLQIQGNYALRVFARTKFPSSNITKVFSSMAEVLVSHLFRILVLHSDSNHLKFSSLRLLHVLGSSFPSALRAISSDKDNSVGLLLSLLSSYKGIGRIAMSLLSLVAEKYEGRDAILGHGGVEKVMQTMKSCLDDPLLLCNGTAVLSWVLLSKPSTEGTFFHPFNYHSVDTLCDINGLLCSFHVRERCLCSGRLLGV